MVGGARCEDEFVVGGGSGGRGEDVCPGVRYVGTAVWGGVSVGGSGRMMMAKGRDGIRMFPAPPRPYGIHGSCVECGDIVMML